MDYRVSKTIREFELQTLPTLFPRLYTSPFSPVQIYICHYVQLKLVEVLDMGLWLQKGEIWGNSV